MRSMIEPLESRQMFSSAAVASVVALRKDLTALSQPLPVLLNNYGILISRITSNLAYYTDQPQNAPLLGVLRAYFSADLHTFARDISVAKVLLNDDLVHLVLAEDALARQPTNPILLRLVSGDQAIITAQSQALLTTLQADAAPLLNDFNNTAGGLATANPIDATLAADLTDTTNLITTVTSEIQTTANRIMNVTVPSFIAAVAPAPPVNPQNNAA